MEEIVDRRGWGEKGGVGRSEANNTKSGWDEKIKEEEEERHRGGDMGGEGSKEKIRNKIDGKRKCEPVNLDISVGFQTVMYLW